MNYIFGNKDHVTFTGNEMKRFENIFRFPFSLLDISFKDYTLKIRIIL